MSLLGVARPPFEKIIIDFKNNIKMKKLIYFLSFICLSVFSLNSVAQQAPQARAPLAAIDLGIFNAPLGSNNIEIRLKSLKAIDMPYTAGRFTVRYPTTSGVTLDILNTNNTLYNPYGYYKAKIGTLYETPASDGFTYVIFGFTVGSVVNMTNWAAGQVIVPPLLTLQVNGAAASGLVFELITGNSWTNNYNGTYYQEIGADSDVGSQNGFYHSSTANIIPLELLFFQAEKKGKTSLVTWETLNEKNLSEYVVERSTDGINFKAIGYQKPKATNVSQKTTYTFLDEEPGMGINYYRLFSKDLDGTGTYSKIVSIDFSAGIKVKTFPNPFYQTLNIEMAIEKSIEGDVSIGLYDIAGKQVLNKKMDGQSRSANFSLPTNDLVPGSYLIRVKAGNYTWQDKITKQ